MPAPGIVSPALSTILNVNLKDWQCAALFRKESFVSEAEIALSENH